MRQKIVVKVQMNGRQHCRTKALGIASALDGVEELRIEGEERDQLVVVGERLDSISLVKSLRKKIGHAYILSLNEVTPDSQQQQQEPQENSGSNPTNFPQGFQNHPVVEYHWVDDPTPNPCCLM